ncbi:MAG: YD repeat-containing protein [Porticoccaceae bacterium]|jgi:YD repeat-containing protein
MHFTVRLQAGVNLKNGNFYISYKDCINPNSSGSLEIVRTFNSKAYARGWFGFGWGSDFETYLVVHPDGVVVHENGTGALTRFTPEESNPGQVSDTVDQLVAVARRRGAAESPTEVKVFANRMRTNVELRIAYCRAYTSAGWIKPIHLPSGTVLHSAVRGLQTVERVPEGYVRTFQSGKTERFNLSGRLIRITDDKDGTFFEVDYDSAGNVAAISDYFGNHIRFTSNAEGLVTKLVDEKGHTVEYEYRGLDLVRSRDTQGDVFEYDYDSNHNLTQIAYADETTFNIRYSSEQFVDRITYRNGDELRYIYEQDPKNPSYHYWTTVKSTGFNGRVRTNRYEYWIKTREDGSNYTQRILTNINGLVTDTLYDGRFSQPIEISRGNKKTTFEYDSAGRLARKQTPSSVIALKYHPVHAKITEVTESDLDGKLVKSSAFEYSETGNLLHAENSKGQTVELTYDSKGHIRKVKFNDETLLMTNNDVGKPIRIEMEGVGSIDVEYDDFGEVAKAESEEGSKIAARVTAAFQKLTTIIKPAGVNLNF